MSLVTPGEFSQILARLCGPAYPSIYQVAELYVRKKLPQQYVPSIWIADQLQCGSLEEVVASAFINAAAHFLNRDSVGRAKTYRRDAETLRAALAILARDNRRDLDSRAADGISEVETLNTADGQVDIWKRTDTRSIDRVLPAIEEIAQSYSSNADDLGRDKKNITYLYCLGRCWEPTLPSLPSAGQACAAYGIVVEAIREVAPDKLTGMKTYDPSRGAREILDLMRAGVAAAIK